MITRMDFFGRFRRLQWKLTFTCTLVTIVVLGIIFIALVTGVTVYLYNGIRQTYTLEVGLTQLAPEVHAALAATPPDRQALQSWLNGFKRTSIDTYGAVLADPANVMIIIDANGQVLASSNIGTYKPGYAASTMLTGKGLKVIQNVLNGATDLSALATREDDQFIVGAVPVHDASNRILGALFVRTQGTNVIFLIYRLLRSVLPIVALIALGVIFMGTIFGALTARGLTARLRVVTEQAGRWGLGDFSGHILDSSTDEIGEMAQDLNRIAGELQSLIQERQRLAATTERSRMARDLHDSVKQQIFALSMNLAAAQALWENNPAEARRQLDQATGLASQAQNELISLIQTQLLPSAEPVDLALKMGQLAISWEKSSGITLKTNIDSSVLAPAETADALYRISQEALANVARHSQATAAWLALKTGSGCINLSIRDNGLGFDASSGEWGMGLNSMEERLNSLNGELSIESSSEGTSLEIRIPVGELA